MKSTGIVRMLDELGRIVLPIELRRVLEIEEKDPMEFFVDPDSQWIMMRKYQTQVCMFCQSMDGLVYFREKFICQSCLKNIRRQVNPELAVPEIAVATAAEGNKLIGESKGNSTPRKQHRRQGKAYKRLLEAMQTHPSGTQSEWARIAEISQSRVSQILHEMKSTAPNEKV
ncbi:AbrB/MazE/SpoVT family DNA-binding domain-containing protein [Paenibacillus macerans]|uniref:AbrB/MazE/SpoVT family DNA-binding domain-containing protein n=1 Tax=Paenibacillus macerans TaxID=44252 RepID=UPI0022E1A95D|nr:AbrB/MazE/SpoVT family DNA-binding domain-containing protein [Paenibacillus macerans]